MKVYRNLEHNCNWNRPLKVKQILDENDDIDLTYSDGIYFEFAFVHDNLELLQILLNYYEEHELQYSPDTLEYKVAKAKLKEILEEGIESHYISDEFLEALQPYLVINPSLYDTDSIGEEHYSDIDLEFIIDDYKPNFGSEYFEQMSEDVDLTGTALIEVP